MRTVAVVAAGGSGKRLGCKTDKPFVPLAGRPIIAYCLEVLESSPHIDDIIIATRARNMSRLKNLIKKSGFRKVREVVAGGKTRFDSVRNCLGKIGPSCDIVLIHDACRPFITREVVRRSVAAARRHGGSVVSVPENDSIKAVDEDLFVRRSLDRRAVWRAQTPQAFKRAVAAAAYRGRYTREATDDSFLVERTGKKVKVLRGSYGNIKITTKEDLGMAEALLRRTRQKVRIGIGYDIHRLVKGRRLFLSGVEIPSARGPVSHSDGDVVLHAVSDAILGAVGRGDIGEYFPDTDPAYKDYPSPEILKKVSAIAAGEGASVVNVDVVIIAKEPRISPFRDKMRGELAAILKVDGKAVNIKATTNEGVGALGRGAAIAAYAVVAMTYSAAQN